MAGDKGQPSPASSRASKSGVRPIPGTATTQVAKAEAWASPARHALRRLAWSRRMSARLWRTSRKRRHTHERTSSNTHTGTRARSHSHAPPCPCSLSLEQPCPLGGWITFWRLSSRGLFSRQIPDSFHAFLGAALCSHKVRAHHRDSTCPSIMPQLPVYTTSVPVTGSPLRVRAKFCMS